MRSGQFDKAATHDAGRGAERTLLEVGGCRIITSAFCRCGGAHGNRRGRSNLRRNGSRQGRLASQRAQQLGLLAHQGHLTLDQLRQCRLISSRAHRHGRWWGHRRRHQHRRGHRGRSDFCRKRLVEQCHQPGDAVEVLHQATKLELHSVASFDLQRSLGQRQRIEAQTEETLGVMLRRDGFAAQVLEQLA